VAKKPIASAAGKTGQVARATAPAVGSPAWLAGASSGDIAVYNLGLAPDYSKVPKVDVKAAASYANAGAEKTLAPVLSEYKQQWTDLAAREQVSLGASTAFTKALSDILTGGQSGEAGRDYALKTFGGSFLGEIQTAEGLKMFVNLSREFDAQDAAIVANMNAAIAKRPDIYKSLYDDFVQQETANQKLGIALADSAYDHRMKAVALILSTRQKQEAAAAKTTRGQVIYAGDGSSMLVDPVTGKKIADLGGARPDTTNVQTQTVGKSLYERDPVTGEWNLAVKGPDAAARQVIYRGDGSSFLIDKATGKKIAELGSARPKGAGSKDTQTGMVAGSLYEKDPADGKWKLAIEGAAGDSQSKMTGAYAVLNGLTANGRATKIIDWKETAANTAQAAFRGVVDKDTKEVSHTSYQDALALMMNHGVPLDIAQDALNRYWKRGEDKSWEKPGQGRPLKSYQERNPGTRDKKNIAYTVPPASFESLSERALGLVGSNLGGPEAHYAKHDSGENWQSNNAWDIGVPVGTPVYAVSDGVIGSGVGVQSSRSADGARLTLTGPDNSYWYGHLSKINVRPGQRVTAGQLLGYSGASQNGAAHLHIAVQHLPSTGASV
jgi:murein DD-endopeptidase MepM/ murein hydrolase activator NlpD